MRYGLVTPVLTLLPRAHATWEEQAGLADVERIALDAERLGYEFVTCSEHVAIPTEIAAARGGRYWDPLSVFGYLAARTTTLHFTTYVLVLGYHHPLEIVKRYGTLDLVSNGRLVLGVGVGSLEQEFALLDAQFEGRGAIADDALRAVRAAWGRRTPQYAGDHFAFDDLIVDPVAPRAHVPIWVGGRTTRSLRRAVLLADGWSPFGLGSDEIARMVTEVQDTGLWTPIDVVLQPQRPFDPSAEPEAVATQVRRMRDAGATALALRFVHHSLAHYLEQLEAMQEIEI